MPTVIRPAAARSRPREPCIAPLRDDQQVGRTWDPELRRLSWPASPPRQPCCRSAGAACCASCGSSMQMGRPAGPSAADPGNAVAAFCGCPFMSCIARGRSCVTSQHTSYDACAPTHGGCNGGCNGGLSREVTGGLCAAAEPATSASLHCCCSSAQEHIMISQNTSQIRASGVWQQRSGMNGDCSMVHDPNGGIVRPRIGGSGGAQWATWWCRRPRPKPQNLRSRNYSIAASAAGAGAGAAGTVPGSVRGLRRRRCWRQRPRYVAGVLPGLRPPVVAKTSRPVAAEPPGRRGGELWQRWACPGSSCAPSLVRTGWNIRRAHLQEGWC